VPISSGGQSARGQPSANIYEIFTEPCGGFLGYQGALLGRVHSIQHSRAYLGKDTTYVLDFVNDPEEILAAFRMYQATAELETVTDPDTLFALKDKLDGQGFYSDNEVDRVINVVMDLNSKQSELIAALEPVASRIMGSYKEAAARLKSAKDRHDADSEKRVNEEISVFLLLKRDMGAYLRMYSFLSQIFDYGNPVMEKRFIFFKHLIPLLEFGRERETIDFSKVSLTHYKLNNKGTRSLPVGGGDPILIPGMGESGTEAVHDSDRKLLEEIIDKVNDLFKGELTDDDKLVYVNRVIKGKLLESDVLGKQAVNNSREQFASSPDLGAAIMNAIIKALDAHTTMSKQALDSNEVRDGLKDILLGPAQLWEALRGKYGDGASTRV
jgi:type I restriction enzyme R subunit